MIQNIYGNATSHSFYYCNPLFDLSLGNADTKELMPAAAEMCCLFIPCTHSGDNILINVSLPDTYWKYLADNRLPCPRQVDMNEQCPGLNGVPWGWNSEAVAVFREIGVQCNNPELSIVRKVNARKFSFAFNTKSQTGVPGACYCTSLTEAQQKIDSWHRFPLVIKPDFGNAGYGFIRKEQCYLGDNELRQLELFFVNGDGVTIEPWYTRTADISSRCTITPEGNILDVRHHRTLSNRAGTFFADLVDPDDAVISFWKETLDTAVYDAANELYKAGYFGPAGFDSFEWLDHNGKRRLAAVIEINARHPMSSVTYALREKLAPDQATLFRFISRKRHRLPETYPALKKILGDDAYSPQKMRGILVVTPLRVSHTPQHWIQPARSAFFIGADSAEKVLALDEKLRNNFLKNR